MNNDLYKMVENTSIKYSTLMSQLTQPLRQYFGIDYFCYQFVSNDGEWFTLGNRPEWILRSIENQFYEFDPSLVHPHHCFSSVCFPQDYQHELFQNTLVKDAVERFNIDHCLAVIEPTIQGCEYLFFAAPKEHTGISGIYLTQLQRLRYDYAQYIRIQIQPILKSLVEHSVNLRKINASSFEVTENLLITDNDVLRSVNFLNEVNSFSCLTPRESQCLMFYKQGLTAKQTARQLGLSHRTIEGYFERIKNKFNVKYKCDLLKKLSNDS